jgi:hypothetical protein
MDIIAYGREPNEVNGVRFSDFLTVSGKVYFETQAEARRVHTLAFPSRRIRRSEPLHRLFLRSPLVQRHAEAAVPPGLRDRRAHQPPQHEKLADQHQNNDHGFDGLPPEQQKRNHDDLRRRHNSASNQRCAIRSEQHRQGIDTHFAIALDGLEIVQGHDPVRADAVKGGDDQHLSRDDGRGDADCGEEGVGATVVLGVDASPVLEPAEHVFDSVALLIESGVVGMATLRLDFEGMQTIVFRSASACRNQSAS